jgi:hypothetical protein
MKLVLITVMRSRIRIRIHVKVKSRLRIRIERRRWIRICICETNFPLKLLTLGPDPTGLEAGQFLTTKEKTSRTPLGTDETTVFH